ncbi:MAG: hypothetical protein DRI90_14895 [Deltaproteobacteria bacterium]|nr:MAG: hypothetical protein DRI90_14895 [Deltaproteobacteria bacterium]
MLGAAAVVAAVASLNSCTVVNEYQDPPIVGDWKPKPETRHRDNKMSIDLEGDGDGTIMFTLSGDDTLHEGDFDIEWDYHSEDEYDIDWECKSSTAGPCGGLDFTIRCDINSDGDELDCVERGDLWDVPEFEWVDD